MALSKALQIGKAGEHLVCVNLIMQGYSAFLADQGLPYDVIVDTKYGLKRIQVKTTTKLISYDRCVDAYRFGLRSARDGRAVLSPADVDYVAFVTLDKYRVGYIAIKDLLNKKGSVIQGIDLRTKDVEYKGRTYSNGTIRERYGRFIEDYAVFK